MPARSRIAAVLAVVTAAVLGAATDAGATTPTQPPRVPIPTVASPLECIEQWEGNPFYLADRYTEARAIQLNGIFMGCGDERSGVIHILSEASSGHTHPNRPENVKDFTDCFENAVRFGKREDDRLFPGTRDAYVYSFTEAGPSGIELPVEARLIVDKERHFVWNMFTSITKKTPLGNNWLGCSGNLFVA